MARLLSLLIVAILVVGCSPLPQPIVVSPRSYPDRFVPEGEPEVRNLGSTTETVWNCGSGGGTVIKHPQRSILTTHAVEWQVGGHTGAGMFIGDGIIPGGVDLSVAFEGRIVYTIEESTQQSTGWDLPAEPNSIVVYTLVWRETWQPGYVNVHTPSKTVIRVTARYRTGIQSDIVDKQTQSCDKETALPAQQATPTITSHGPIISYSPELCGEAAYEAVFYDENGVKKADLTFTFPNGYTDGFITSDPGLVEFSDSQARLFTTQFVLITRDFSWIRVKGVTARQDPPNSGRWVPNTHGCIFVPQDAEKAESYARNDYQIKVNANNRAELYRVTPDGFELLNSNK